MTTEANEIEKSAESKIEESEIRKLINVHTKFSQQMLDKIFEKYLQGWRGWDHPRFESEIMQKIHYSLSQEKFIDTANFLMFLDYHKSEAQHRNSDENFSSM